MVDVDTFLTTLYVMVDDFCQTSIRFCRKFSFEAICGMVSLPTHAAKEERDNGAQLQRGSFPTRHYADGRPLVCRLPFAQAPRRRTPAGTWGPRGSLDHHPMGGHIQPAAGGSLSPPQAAGVAQLAPGRAVHSSQGPVVLSLARRG